jgi:predicted RNase H-like nuclease (RuvC/YqgF family)
VNALVEQDTPMELGIPMEQDAPVAVDVLVEPDAPIESHTHVEQDAHVEVDTPLSLSLDAATRTTNEKEEIQKRIDSLKKILEEEDRHTQELREKTNELKEEYRRQIDFIETVEQMEEISLLRKICSMTKEMQMLQEPPSGKDTSSKRRWMRFLCWKKSKC